MFVNYLKFENLRCHSISEYEFEENFNIIYGNNGIGKTTILEAISICSMSKSFTNGTDQTILKETENRYNINLFAKNDNQLNYKVNVSYELNKKKSISNSYVDNCSAKELISQFPLVILNPDMKEITAGAPSNRRSFIDKILSYTNISYYQTLVDFKKVLKYRNSLLNSALKDRYFDYALLEPWTDKFIELSAKIIFNRIKFVYEFLDIYKEYYSEISSSKEVVDLNYKIHCDKTKNIINSVNNIYITNSKENNLVLLENQLKEIYEESKIIERRRGITTFGPHKDDLEILLNDRLSKDKASQGQHKTLLISLKFAELDYIEKIRNEKPVVLLDDIFSELDEHRSAQLLSVLSKNKSQVLITLTETNKISFIDKLGIKYKLFNLK
ncbi:MAG: DNA replication/repair protein RecF [Candidatus Kapaibacteriota bacterium]|jgi:DNA replication and repair protein RecF